MFYKAKTILYHILDKHWALFSIDLFYIIEG